MKTIEMDQATASLAEHAGEVKEEPVLLTEHGHPVAALLSLETEDEESLALSANPQFLEIIERSRARLAAEGASPARRCDGGSGWSARERKARLLAERRQAGLSHTNRTQIWHADIAGALCDGQTHRPKVYVPRMGGAMPMR